MIDEVENDDEQIIFEDHNLKKIQERKVMNEQRIETDIRDILFRKERIKEILSSDHGGAKLGGSVWNEENIFENTEYGRIYSMSDVNLKTLIDFHSNPGDIILDPFAGYLNSAETILKMERSYIGYESFEPYFQKLKSKLQILKEMRDSMGLETNPYDIYNEDSSNIHTREVDMVLTTLPEPLFPDKGHRTREMMNEVYERYLENIEKPLRQSYDNLKDNHFMVIHCKDSVKGFIYRPIFIEIAHIIPYPLKYTLILDVGRSPSGTLGDNGEMFKLYSEQTFPYSHQYVFCFYKGEGRLR